MGLYGTNYEPAFAKLSSRRWNLIIRMVNEGFSRAKAIDKLNDVELRLFDSLKKQFNEYKKDNPRFQFEMIENDW